MARNVPEPPVEPPAALLDGGSGEAVLQDGLPGERWHRNVGHVEQRCLAAETLLEELEVRVASSHDEGDGGACGGGADTAPLLVGRVAEPGEVRAAHDLVVRVRLLAAVVVAHTLGLRRVHLHLEEGLFFSVALLGGDSAVLGGE